MDAGRAHCACPPCRPVPGLVRAPIALYVSLRGRTRTKGLRMSSGLTRFLGDTPLRTIIKLTVVSFVVGVILTALDLSILDLLHGVQDFVLRIWNMGFDAIRRFGQYFVVGAAIVVPVFLIIRVLQYRR